MAEKKQRKQRAKAKKQASPPEGQPHPFWSGVVAFGLVSLPVSLFPATRGKSLALKMVDRDGTPLERRYFCEKEGRVIDRDDIVRGYPIDKDRFVIVEDDELESLAPEKTREIDLRRFVPVDDINPIFFERGYFLAPEEGVTKAYRLLVKSMAEERRAGIATFVMRDKEYLVAILSENGILRAETLRFQEEIRTPETVGLPEIEPAEKGQVKQIRQAMKRLYSKDLNPSLLVDHETKRVRELARDKLNKRKDVTRLPEPARYEEDANVVDLMQVLKERLEAKPTSEEQRESPGSGANKSGPRKSSQTALDSLNRKQLYEKARERGVRGRSKMSRDELLAALEETA